MAVALLLVSSAASAQSLGTPSAHVWLGRALDVSIPARIDPADGDTGCVRADVFYGDQRVADAAVQASLQRQGDRARVHVRTTVPIDEPAVALAVQAGCRNTISRRYTLLAEPLPSDVTVAAAIGERLAAAEPVPEAALATRAAGAPPFGALGLQRAVDQAAPAARATPRAVRTVFTRDAAPAAPRLEVATHAFAADHPAMLRVTAMLSDPVGDARRRATAALLWQALNAQPEERMRTSAMLQQLEREIAELRNAATRTRTGIVQARAANDLPLVAGVTVGVPRLTPALLTGGLLAALLAATALFWLRTRQQNGASAFPFSDWTRRPEPQTDLDGLDSGWMAEQAGEVATRPETKPLPPIAPLQRRALADDPLAVQKPPVVAVEAIAAAENPPQGGPAPEVQAQPAGPQTPAPVAKPRPRPNAALPVLPVLRMEALMSALQEAEFHAMLGLWGDAKNVLKRYLRDANAPATIAFYELMLLCEKTCDSDGLIAVRRRFHQVFRVPAPTMEDLGAPAGADVHAKLMARISDVWPSPVVMGLIERRLFSPPAEEELRFSLQAWRDLLWLYGLVREMLDAGIGEEQPAPEAAALAPWADPDHPEDLMALDGAHADFGTPSRFGIDLPLDLVTRPEEIHEGELMLESVLPGPAPKAAAVVDDGDDLMSAVVAAEGRRALR